MNAIYQFLHEWAMLLLLLCVILFILVAILNVRKPVDHFETDESDDDYFRCDSDDADIPAEDVTDDIEEERDEQAELLRAYIELGSQKVLTVEEECEYVRLSELLARNYVCVGHPEID